MLGSGGSGEGVVSMTDREKMRRLAPLRQVEAYWHGLCARDAVPLRSQIDPRGMDDALENAFLMERIAPTMAKIRVAGTHLNDLMGMQIAGMPLSSLIVPGNREEFGVAVGELFAGPAIVRLDLVAEGGFGKPAMEAHMVLLPLRSDFGDQTRALGALVSHGRIGRTPRRFALTNVEVSPALSDRPAVPVERSEKPESVLREDPAPYEPRPAADRDAPRAPVVERGHLKLIVSND